MCVLKSTSKNVSFATKLINLGQIVWKWQGFENWIHMKLMENIEEKLPR